MKPHHRELKRLNPRHRLLASLVAHGWKIKDALAEVQFSRSHWDHCIKDSALFLEEVSIQEEKVRAALFQASIDDVERIRARRLVPLAVDRLRRLLETGTTKQQLAAAEKVLRHAFR